MSEANEITANLLVEIPQQFPQVRIWRNNRVKAMALGRGGKPRLVSAGINGQADLSGIIGPVGRRCEIEVKAGKDTLSREQIQFGHMIRSLGGVYIIARDVQAALKSLQEVIDGQ